jgi:hypothetical protein
VTHGSAVTDFVICFECKQVEVWGGDKEIAQYPITSSPQAIFNRVLEAATIPLAGKPL